MCRSRSSARSSAVALQHLEQRLRAEVERCDRNPLVRGVDRLLAEAAWQSQRQIAVPIDSKLSEVALVGRARHQERHRDRLGLQFLDDLAQQLIEMAPLRRLQS